MCTCASPMYFDDVQMNVNILLQIVEWLHAISIYFQTMTKRQFSFVWFFFSFDSMIKSNTLGRHSLSVCCCHCLLCIQLHLSECTKTTRELDGKRNFRSTHLIISHSVIISVDFCLMLIIILSSYARIRFHTLEHYNRKRLNSHFMRRLNHFVFSIGHCEIGYSSILFCCFFYGHCYNV